MSKNSFTKNFNSCVAGFPIASVAAHMILHEGLLKDIGKVGALAGLGYLGYNYGDKLGEWTHDAGEWLNNQGAHIGSWNIGNTVNTIGDKLTGAHNWAKEGLQDSVLGQATGLGGPEAQQRRNYEAYFNNGADAIRKNHNAEIAQTEFDYANNKISAAERDTRKAQIEQQSHDSYNDLQAKADAEAASKVKNGQYTYKSQAQANPYQSASTTNQSTGQPTTQKPGTGASTATLGQPGGQQPGTPAPAKTTGQPAGQPAAPPQPGAGTTTPGQPNGQQPASGSGVDFSAQNNLKNFNLGGSFIPNQNQPRPSPFGPKQQPSKPLPPGREVPA